MKKLLLTLASLLVFGAMLFAQDTSLSWHDIAYNGIQQGCRSCHIPHGGTIAGGDRNTIFGGSSVSNSSTGENKLWDKVTSTQAYTTYSSDNVTGGSLKPTSSTDPAWHSYLCFSCHDGAVASLNLSTSVVTDFLMNSTASSTPPDTDLTNDHPVDIAWPAADTTDYDTVANVTGTGTVYGTAGVVQSLPLYGGALGKVECSSCHNPHKQPATVASGFRGNFLRLSNVADNTSLCRVCHLGKR